MKKILGLMIISLSFSLFNCSTSEPKIRFDNKPTEEYGIFYLMRENRLFAMAVPFTIYYENGIVLQKLGQLTSGSYYVFKLPIGKHKISAKMDMINTLSIDVKPNSIQYFNTYSILYEYERIIKFEELDKEFGEYLRNKTRYKYYYDYSVK